MKFLIVVAIIGFCAAAKAFEPSKEYLYDYSGRVAAGIPELDTQVSGSGLKAKLRLQVSADGSSAVGKLENVLVGSLNEHIDQNFTGYGLPIHYYKPDLKISKMLETPFKVELTVSRPGWIESIYLPTDMPTWVGDITKSIVALLRVDTSKASNKPSGGEYQLSKYNVVTYNNTEDSIHGRCRYRYVVIPYDEITADETENKIVQTIQKESGQHTVDAEGGFQTLKDFLQKRYAGVKFTRDLYYVKKSVDFNDCEESARYTSIHPFGVKDQAPATAQVKNFMARSSVSTYAMRGDHPSCLSVELVFNEGSTTITPFGYHTEVIAAISNQTLVFDHMQSYSDIIKVGKVQRSNSFRADQRTLVAAAYDMQSNAAAVGDIPREQYDLPFFVPQDELVQGAMMELNIVVKQLEDAHVDVVYSNTTSHYQRLYKYLNKLDKSGMESFYKKVTNQQHKAKTQFAIDAMTAIGTEPSVTILLNEIKDRKMSTAQAAEVLMALPASLKYSREEFLMRIMDVVEALDFETQTQAKVSGLINFARLVHNACVDEQRSRYMYPITEEKVLCHPSFVDQVLPIYKKGLQSATSKWEKLVYIQAMGNFGTPSVFDVVQKYITGEATDDAIIRQIAIWTLSTDNVAQKYYPQIIDFLIPIAENFNEIAEIRMAAITMIINMNPTPNTIQRFAFSTWHEQDREVHSFIYSVIRTFSISENPRIFNQSAICRHLLAVMKPIDNLDIDPRSYGYMLSQYLDRIASGVTWWSGIMYNQQEFMPRNMYTSLFVNAGGYNFNYVAFGGMSTGTDEVMREVLSQLEKKMEIFGDFKQVADSQQAKEVIQQIKELVGPVIAQKYPSLVTFYVRGLDEVQRLFIGESDQQITYAYLLEKLHELLQSLESEGTKIKYAGALYGTDSRIVIPTDVGLPIVAQNFMQFLFAVNAKPVVSLSRGIFEIHSNAKLAINVHTSLQIMAPHVGEIIVSGVENLRGNNAPFDFSLLGNWKESRVEIVAKSNLQSEAILYTSENRPYTVRIPATKKPMYEPMPELSDYLIINADNKTYETVIPSIGHLPFTYVVNSSKETTPAKIIAENTEARKNPAFKNLYVVSRHSHYIKRSIVFDRLNSCKGLKFNFVFALDAKKTETGVPAHHQQQQQSQLYSQISQMKPSFKPAEASSQRYAAIKSFQKKIVESLNSGTVYTQSAAVGCIAEPKNPFFDAVFTYAYDISTYNKFFNLIFVKAPATKNANEQMCAKMQVSYPQLSSLSSIKETLQNPLKTIVKASAFPNMDCNGQQILALKGSFDVSAKWQQVVSKKSKVQECLEYETSEGKIKFEDQQARLEKQCQYIKKHVTAYDFADFTLEFDNVPTYLKNVSLKFESLAKAFGYQYIFANSLGVSNPEKKMRLVAERKPISTHWNLHIQKPTENVLIQELPMMELSAVGKQSPFFGENMCAVSKDHIVTFDGVSYPFKNSKCEQVLAQRCSQNDKSAVILFEKNGKPAIKIADETSGHVIEMSEGYFKIDEKTIKMAPEGFMYQPGSYYTEWYNGFIKIDTYSGIHVILKKDSVQVYASNLYKNQMCGLCGDMNQSPKADLVGPKKCVYSQAKLFAASWIIPQGSCASPAEQQAMQAVKEFQKDCPRLKYSPIFEVYQKLTSAPASC